MKFLIFSLLLLSDLFAGTVAEYAATLNAQTDFNKAYTQAKNEKKDMILLLIVKEGCHWCDKMVKLTLQDNTVKYALSDTVIVVTDLHSELAKRYNATLTPTMVFIDAKTKKSLYQQVGYEKVGAFMITIVSAVDNLP